MSTVGAGDVILSVLAKAGGRVPATKLVKLVYLVDYIHYQHFGETVTGLEYQWDNYGPNAVKHGIISKAEWLAQENQINYRPANNLWSGTAKYFNSIPDSAIPTLPDTVEMVISDVVNRYGKLSVRDITAASKKTGPFKKASQYDMLTMEQSAPAMSTTAEDTEAYRRDVEERGTLTLEQVKREYRLK